MSRFCLFKKTPPFINVLYNKTGAEIKTVCELLSDYLLTEAFSDGITDSYKAFLGGIFLAIEKVREYFRAFGMEDKILEFEVSSATVELAAAALGCEGKRIAKTLSFMVGEKPILIVAAGDARIANPKYKAKFGTKAVMLSFEDAEKLIGHAVGGVCPFAVNEGVAVYLDESLNIVDGFTQDIYFGSSNVVNNLPTITNATNNTPRGYRNPMSVVSYSIY